MKKAKTFDIRKKLLGAVAMLLVATIMMVSATYAWFTLSTAPEVKGITTTVGANGNLEIALNTTGTAPGTAAIGDSMAVQSTVLANETWGNLVDLSDESYGLDQIALRPAMLLAANNEIGAVALKTPAYGSDGRVKAQVDFRDTFMASYDGAAWTGTGSGIRAIGESSGMSEAELALASAKTAASTARREARAKIQQTLQNNGDALTGAMMKHGLATAENPDTYDQADLTALSAIIAGMKEAESSIEAALVSAVKAFLASDSGNADAYAGAKLITSWAGIKEAATTAGVTLPEQFSTVDTQLTALNGKISAAESKIADAQTTLTGAGSLTWDQYKAPLNDLFDTTTNGAVTVEGFGVNELGENAVTIATKLTSGVAVVMNDGSGIFSDFASFIGEFTANVTIASLHVEYGESINANVENAKFNMTAKSNTSPAYMTAVETVLSGLVAPTSSGSENPGVDTTFGYILDFWVRTNAANSALKLQIDAAQRIYDDSNNTATQGEGCYMQFGAAPSSGLSDDQVKSLMNAIRVVFLTPSEGGYSILAYAKLGTPAAAEDEWKAPLALYTPGNGTEENPTDVLVEDTTLMQLTQNQATQLSVLVYMDGNLVDNTMVSATTATSMIGAMNLQFTTDAELLPMQNTALFNGDATPAETDAPVNGG